MSAKYKLIIFDLDGTLIDSSKDIVIALEDVLSQEQLLDSVTAQRLDEASKYGVLNLIKEIVLEDTKRQQIYEKFKLSYEQGGWAHTTVYSEVLDTLELLKSKCTLVVWTNKIEQFTTPTLKKLKLDHYFQAVYSNESFEQKKPHGDPVRSILKNFQLNNTEALIVGDTENDLISGSEAAIDTCLAIYGYGKSDLSVKYSPQYKIKSFSELLKII